MTMLEWMEIFGDNLTDILKDQFTTQDQLAKNCKIPKGTISKYVNKKQAPAIPAIINMAYELNVDIDEFVDFDDSIEM